VTPADSASFPPDLDGRSGGCRHGQHPPSLPVGGHLRVPASCNQATPRRGPSGEHRTLPPRDLGGSSDVRPGRTFATWPGLLETFGRLEAAAGLALEGAELAASQGAGALARPVPDRDCPRSAVRARPLGRRRGAAGSRGRPGRLELAATWVYLSAPSPARDLRQLRHPQVPGRSRLGAQALPRRTALHAHLGILAQPGRGVLLQFSDEAPRLIDSLDRHPLQA
jgi:hypothetical protein